MDDPLLPSQSAEGERHQLRQTVPPVLPDDGALQNGQPPTGTISLYYGCSALGGSNYGNLCVGEGDILPN